MTKQDAVADYVADLDLLEQMFSDTFDWSAWYKSGKDDEPDDVFRRVYRWHDYRRGDRSVGVIDCGGQELIDTAHSLYRACYLLFPGEVEFSSMYKTGTLIDFCSPDFEFVCSFQLHKYEACVRFSCAPRHAVGTPKLVRGGWASCDNGVRCKSKLGSRWFAVAVTALERKWCVYSGNDFWV